jgi:hypothetical protein
MLSGRLFSGAGVLGVVDVDAAVGVVVAGVLVVAGVSVFVLGVVVAGLVLAAVVSVLVVGVVPGSVP